MADSETLTEVVESGDASVKNPSKAIQEDTDRAVICLVCGVDFAFDEVNNFDDTDISERTSRLSWLSYKFGVHWSKIEDISEDNKLLNNGKLTRKGVKTILSGQDESIDESVERLLTGGLLTQKSTSEHGFEIEYSTLGASEVGDRYVKSLHDIMIPDNRR
jgi:hypothetical protein